MENTNREELVKVISKFVESAWDLVAAPSKEWLEGNIDSKELLVAIEQADKECGSCGCEYDPLYKRAIKLLKAF